MIKLSFSDRIISACDNALRTLAHAHRQPVSYPADGVETEKLSDSDQKLAASLMRINHTGEVCAQALYQGQLLFAHNESTQKELETAAEEETYHLKWCEQRLHELDGRTSYINPLFYAGSFTLGAIASFMGDKTSLGFLAETEHQVEQHLTGHLDKLPAHDARSRAVVMQMREDEIKHREQAIQHGGEPLPAWIQKGMRLTAKIMTSTTRFI